MSHVGAPARHVPRSVSTCLPCGNLVDGLPRAPSLYLFDVVLKILVFGLHLVGVIESEKIFDFFKKKTLNDQRTSGIISVSF